MASHETSLWPTLAWRCLDVLAIFATLVLLRFIWVQSIWRIIGRIRHWRGKSALVMLPTARSCWLLTLGGVRGAVTLAGVMSVPLLIGADQAFPQRDLLIFIAAGVILLSLVSACIALPLLLRGVDKSADERMDQEVQEAWRRTAEAAIHALEAEDLSEADAPQNADLATLAVELKGRLMAEYRDQLERYNHSAETRALAERMDQLERHLRLKALRAQRLELYALHRRHQVGNEVVRQILGELDLSEANLARNK